jgi:hypothetical protein
LYVFAKKKAKICGKKLIYVDKCATYDLNPRFTLVLIAI